MFSWRSSLLWPKEFEKQVPIHRYGPNQFKLFGLPTPRPNQVLGLVGSNGLGKSTALKMLSGQKLNLGRYNDPPNWYRMRASQLET